MAPLNPNNTARYKVFYTVGGVQHTQEVRSAVSPAVFGPMMEAYYEDLDTAIYATVIDDVQFAAATEDVFNSVDTSLQQNTYGSGTQSSVASVPFFYNFIGRSSGGRRMRFAQYGANGFGVDFRFAAGEDARLDAALADIVSATASWLAIDGIKPVMKTYINMGVNAYWQRNVRP